MKLLSICVPTYNRSDDIESLYRDFLSKALEVYGDDIEVVVCDNSDNDHAVLNQKSLGEGVRYFKNEFNLGFAGNILRCVKESQGKFIWIISDNDPVIWNGFQSMLADLPMADQNDIDCVMLPFQTSNPYGDTVNANYHADWGVGQDSDVQSLVATNNLPFILFSSAVIRVDKSNLSEVEKNYLDNDYVQIILFLSMLKPHSRVRFATETALDYQPEYKCRFRLLSMSRSMLEVRKFLEMKFHMQPDYHADYRYWLRWLLLHRGGLYDIRDADKERWGLLSELPNHMNIKNILFAMVTILPKMMVQPIYLIYRSILETKNSGKFSIRQVGSRLVVYWKFIHETHG